MITSAKELYIIGGIWDLIFWNAVAHKGNSCMSGNCIVYSLAFTPEQQLKVEAASRALGLNPLPYTDNEVLLSIVSGLQIENIRLIHSSDVFTQKVIELKPDAHLILGFEGLAGYFPSAAIKKRLSSPYTYVHYSNLPVPAWIETQCITYIDSENLRYSIEIIRQKLNLNSRALKIESCDILVIGQHFHRHKVLTWKQEHSLYEKYIHQKISEGHTIAWKEHPRNTHPFGPDYAAKFSDRFHTLEMDPLYAIELWANEISRLKVVAGASSNSLFNLRDIYGINTTSIIEPDTLAEFDFSKLNKSSLINLIGISYLNHDGNLPMKYLISAFQKSPADSVTKHPTQKSIIVRVFNKLKRITLN